MTYQELLSQSKWRERRIDILLRDRHKCTNCGNEEILKNTHIGTMFYNGPYHSGLKYTLRSLNGEVRQTILLKTDTGINEKGYIAYVNKEDDYSKLGKVLAVRKSQLTIRPTYGEGNFLNELLKLELQLPIQSLQWVYVPGLHIHHKYYQKGKLPWEYPDEALQTMCWQCHENLHRNIMVPYLDERGNDLGMLTPCYKCHGAGYFPEYKHIQAGICFSCNGTRYIELMHLT